MIRPVWALLAVGAGGFVVGVLLALIESTAVVRAIRRWGAP